MTYSGYLQGPVKIERDATGTLRHLLARIRQTPHKLYLLIDEYDNFINDVMVEDAAAYRVLVTRAGPFKEVFKSVKSALEGLEPGARPRSSPERALAERKRCQ